MKRKQNSGPLLTSQRPPHFQSPENWLKARLQCSDSGGKRICEHFSPFVSLKQITTGKATDTGKKLISHPSGGWTVQRRGYGSCILWWRPSWAPPVVEKHKASPCSLSFLLLIKPQSHRIRAPPSRPHLALIASPESLLGFNYPLNTSHWEMCFSMNGGDIQTIYYSRKYDSLKFFSNRFNTQWVAHVNLDNIVWWLEWEGSPMGLRICTLCF